MSKVNGALTPILTPVLTPVLTQVLGKGVVYPGWLIELTGGDPSGILLAANLRYGQEKYWAGGKEVSATSFFGSVSTPAKVVLRDGVLTATSANTLPIADDGLLIEEARTNLFLNSDAPVTQTINLATTGSYTLSVKGTGTVAIAANTATITGAGTASDGTDVVINCTATGTVDCTVTGSPDYVQLEKGAYSTSPIITAGSSVTRAADSIYRSLTAAEIAALGVAGTMAITYKVASLTADATHLATSNNTNATRINLTTDQIGRLQANIVDASTTTFSAVFGTYTAGTVGRSAIAFAANDARAAHNGTLSTADTSVTVPTGIDRLVAGAIIAGSVLGVRHLETIAVWSSRKTDSFIQGWGA